MGENSSEVLALWSPLPLPAAQVPSQVPTVLKSGIWGGQNLSGGSWSLLPISLTSS